MPVSVINNNPDEPFPYVGHPIDVINNEKKLVLYGEMGKML